MECTKLMKLLILNSYRKLILQGARIYFTSLRLFSSLVYAKSKIFGRFWKIFVLNLAKSYDPMQPSKTKGMTSKILEKQLIIAYFGIKMHENSKTPRHLKFNKPSYEPNLIEI